MSEGDETGDDGSAGSERALFPRYEAANPLVQAALRVGRGPQILSGVAWRWSALQRPLPRLFLPRTRIQAQEPPEEKVEEPGTELTFIAIRLLDEQGNPMAGAGYRIEPPGGGPITGTLDDQGEARVEGIDPGACTVSFPDLAEQPLPPMPA